jgi:ParB-like chromosome segregation protein Spo0J
MNDVRREKYQVMPALPAEDYEALKADIAARGVMVAIEMDEYGNVLDGYNRIKVCRELGINDYPVVVRSGLSEAEKLTHARRVNLLRRHLSQEQRRQLVADELRGDPSRSDRQIAAGLGVDHKTVGAARDRLGGTGEIPQLEKTTGTDGKARPVNRQHKRRLNSGIGKTTPSRDKKAGPSPMLDPRAWSLSTPQAREAFVRDVGPRDIEAVIKAIRLNDQLPEAADVVHDRERLARFKRLMVHPEAIWVCEQLEEAWCAPRG